jgi:hypothetical protein
MNSRRHSITSSAMASRFGGMVRPSALAVLRLMTRSNLVGRTTGKSPVRDVAKECFSWAPACHIRSPRLHSARPA